MAQRPKLTELNVIIGGVLLMLFGALLAGSSNHIIELIGVIIILAVLCVCWITWFFF